MTGTSNLLQHIQPQIKLNSQSIFITKERWWPHEVVQAYIEYPESDDMPLKEFKAFKKVTIKKGNTSAVTLSIPVSELQNGTQ